MNKTSHLDYQPKKTSSYLSGTNNTYYNGFSTENHVFNDSLTSLNSLSLGSQNKKVSCSGNTGQRVFETRIYSTSSPELFNRNSRYNQSKRSILAPPKLRSRQTMIEASWVAGGYWQTPVTELPSSLSRSSSQSSGIGSMYNQSRDSSLHDLDQCSVMSSADQQYCFTRPNDGTQFIDSKFKCKHRNNSLTMCNANNPITSSKSETSESPSLQYQCHAKHDIQCSGHTTTIVMNPVWLPALLFGSLALNILVASCTLFR